MSRGKQGQKAGRRERHLAHQQFLKEAKRLRKQRAKAHHALGEAARLKRSRRKGTADFDAKAFCILGWSAYVGALFGYRTRRR